MIGKVIPILSVVGCLFGASCTFKPTEAEQTDIYLHIYNQTHTGAGLVLASVIDSLDVDTFLLESDTRLQIDRDTMGIQDGNYDWSAYHFRGPDNKWYLISGGTVEITSKITSKATFRIWYAYPGEFRCQWF